MENKIEKKIYKQADEIFQIDDRPIREIFVPEWDTFVKIRVPDALALHKSEESSKDEDGNKNNLEWMLKVIYKGTFQEDGKTPFFQPGHLEKLKERNPGAIATLFQAIMEKSKGKKPENSKN